MSTENVHDEQLKVTVRGLLLHTRGLIWYLHRLVHLKAAPYALEEAEDYLRALGVDPRMPPGKFPE